MRISFTNLDEFAEEVKARGIKKVYRDFQAETKIMETTNQTIGRLPVETVKLVLTATDQKDILRTEYNIFRSLYVSEQDKDKVRNLMEKYDKTILPHTFKGLTIRKGVIENL